MKIRLRNTSLLPPTATWRRSVGACALIGLLTMLVYFRSLQAPCYVDDYPYVVQNPLIQTVSGLFDREVILASQVDDDVKNSVLTRPLTYLTFAVNYAIHGTDVRGYHLANTLIHLGNAWLVFLLVLVTYRAGRRDEADEGVPPPIPKEIFLTASATAALFAVHPVMTNAVTHITQRMASLATFFYLTTMLLYALCFQKRDNSFGFLLYMLAIVFCGAAMASKQTAFTLPVMLLLYDVTFLADPLKRRIVRLAPFFAAVGFAALLLFGRGGGATPGGEGQRIIANAVGFAVESPFRYLTTRFDANPAVASFESITPLEYLASQARVIATYQRLLLVPVGLTFFREATLFRSFAEWEVLLPAGFHLLLLGTAFLLFRRSRGDSSSRGYWLRATTFGIAWFYLALVMESSIIPMDNLALEQRMYLPAFGFLVALTAAVMLLVSRGRDAGDRLLPAGILLGIVMCTFAVLTFLRNEQWRDPLVFWQDNLKRSPGKTRIHAFLGNIYYDRGEIPRALQEYKQAFSGNYRYWQDHYALGGMFFDNGYYRDAVDECLAALKLSPDNPAVYSRLAEAYRMLGEGRLSDQARQKALEGSDEKK